MVISTPFRPVRISFKFHNVIERVEVRCSGCFGMLLAFHNDTYCRWCGTKFERKVEDKVEEIK